jgi:hypothetical protein
MVRIACKYAQALFRPSISAFVMLALSSALYPALPFEVLTIFQNICFASQKNGKQSLPVL